MFSDYFLALFLSHLAGDFVFQTDELCKMKIDTDIKRRVLGVSVHVVIIFIITTVVFEFVFQDIPWFVLFLVSFLHGLVDIVKSTIQSEKRICNIDSVKKSIFTRILGTDKTSSRREQKNDRVTGTIPVKINNTKNNNIETKTNKANNWTVFFFFGDQVLHLIIIFITAHALYNFDVNHYMNFYDQYARGTVTISKSLSLMKKVLLFLIYLCLATSVSNVVVRTLLGGLRKDLGADVKTGRYIGGVERILTIGIILAGAWHALAALYGSKTAIRFDQAKESPDFAEYYILGTSLSVLFSVIIAVAAKITFY